MTPQIVHQEALLQLLEASRLPESEVVKRLDLALNPEYWRELNPSLTIDVAPSTGELEHTSASPSELNNGRDAFATRNYFQINSLISAAAAERLRRGIELVMKAGWPPVFSFVYSEFWQASRSPSLVKLLTDILGPHYRQSCHLWTHYVHPQAGAVGWPPHVDNPGRKNRVTVWIALNDATLDNGCLYFIARDLASPELVSNFIASEPFSGADLRALLQGARAVPVQSGSVLGWGPELIHWSAYANEPRHARISISQEFISHSETPRDDELPLFDLDGSLPSFEQRLFAIGTGILAYQKVETLLIRYLDLARKLVDATALAAK